MKKLIILTLLHASVIYSVDETQIQKITSELEQKSTEELKKMITVRETFQKLFVNETLSYLLTTEQTPEQITEKEKILKSRLRKTGCRNLISRIKLLKCYKKHNSPHYNEQELTTLENILDQKIENELTIAKAYPSSNAKIFLELANKNNFLSNTQQELFNSLNSSKIITQKTNKKQNHNPPLMCDKPSFYTMILCLMSMILGYLYH